MRTKSHDSSGADPEFLSEKEEAGNIEHDKDAFMEELASWKRSGEETAGVPGFAPAGIKGSDSDEVVVHKWQAYMKSPKFAGHKGKHLPKRVEMAFYRQDGGDEALAAKGLEPYQIADFNRGRLSQQMRLAIDTRTSTSHGRRARDLVQTLTKEGDHDGGAKSGHR